MDKKAADYYDLPTEWIPSPNFAGRFASEISEINFVDGLWTFMGSSSCSDSEDSPTPHVQSPVGPTKPELVASETVPIDENRRPLGRSLSDDVKTLGRAPMMKKAATAPPSGVIQPGYAAQPPRRAVSARLGLSGTVKGRNPQRERVVADPLSIQKSLHDETLGPRAQLPRPPRPPRSPPPQMLCNKNRSITEPHPSGSFSEKARVKKTLDNKNMGRLKTDCADFESKELLSRPTSMMSTPRELYAIPEKGDLPSPRSVQRDLVLDLSRTSALPAKSIIYGRYSPGYIEVGEEGGRTIYVPGAIRLGEHPAQLRRDPVASLDPFAKTMEPKGKQVSDLIGLEGIVLYFEDLGIVGDATRDSLDRYWLDGGDSESETVSGVLEVRKASIETVKEPVLHSSRKASGAESSKFSSFSSDSSTSSRPQTETPMRQRDKLRRLLSPALPGSAFLRAPANWGQHS
jgi:hypothetical protein